MGTKKQKKKKSENPAKWIIKIFVMTIVISAVFSFCSEIALEASTLAVALLILLGIVFVGIIFDIIGVAVTAADEKTLHGMASRKVKGAKKAVSLMRKANKVSSVCNDVIGDVCGVVSGSATAVIAARILLAMKDISYADTFIPLALSAMVAALTVSGKAIGKIIAINHAEQIILVTGRFLSVFDA